jgi:DNA repair protein RadC
MPVLYAHDGAGFRVASPGQVLVQAQHLVQRQFHRDGPLVNQPQIVRAMLQLKLGAHPRAVFAAVIAARNDPAGVGTPTLLGLADASKLRWLLGTMDIPLVDYLIVGREIASLLERGHL